MSKDQAQFVPLKTALGLLRGSRTHRPTLMAMPEYKMSKFFIGLQNLASNKCRKVVSEKEKVDKQSFVKKK